MKKFIGQYKEFGDGKESITNSFSQSPYPGQSKIAEYVRNGGVLLDCAPSILRDIITNEKISEPQETRSDEFFVWFSELAYYIEKYNLRLPAEFENHILQSV